MSKLLSLYGLKFHPFRPDVPIDALYTTPSVDSYLRRVELGIADGGFAMLTGDRAPARAWPYASSPSASAHCPTCSWAASSIRRAAPWTSIASSPTCSASRSPPTIAGRASRPCAHAGASTSPPPAAAPFSSSTRHRRPCPPSSASCASWPARTYSKQLLCVVFAGDARLPERLRSAELLPLGSRIRRRLTLDYASRDELLACLDHLLAAAGNPSLMTSELRVTLADHAAGNYRVLMNLGDELLAVAADRELARLDEKLFLDVFAQTPKVKPAQKKR